MADEIEIRGTDGVLKMIASSGRQAEAGARNAMRRIAKIVVKRAFEFAPKSPTQAILSRTLKIKKRTSRKTTPGGLERSIRGEHGIGPDGAFAKVFVAANAEAGKYAKRIHDEKGQTWWRRGPGTVAKGPQADEKFVSRAIDDQKHLFVPILEQEISRSIGSSTT